MATYLIGDIQGCLDPLERLLEACRFDPADDHLWLCGDLVNRGGQSLGVLRLLHGIAPRVSVTLGNHDLHLLAHDARHPNGGSPNREFNAILRAPDRESLIQWLNSQPLAAWSETHQLLRVHAGVPPDWTWQRTLALADEVSTALQAPDRKKFLKKMYGNRPRRFKDQGARWKRLRIICALLTRLRFCDAQGRADFRTSGGPGSGRKGFKPWFRHKHRATRDVRMAFGHWAALGLRVKKRYVALDSGCVWGGQLTAWRLEDGALFQVPGRD